jgi:hypothetical protein
MDTIGEVEYYNNKLHFLDSIIMNINRSHKN